LSLDEKVRQKGKGSDIQAAQCCQAVNGAFGALEINITGQANLDGGHEKDQ
jgi:hypothetical protein